MLSHGTDIFIGLWSDDQYFSCLMWFHSLKSYRKLMLLRLVVVNVDARVQRNKLLWNKFNWLWQRQWGVSQHPGAICSPAKQRICAQSSKWCKRKHDISTPSSIALWSRSGVHMTISGAISSLHGSEWTPRLVWSYKSSHKINRNDTFPSEPAFTFTLI